MPYFLGLGAILLLALVSYLLVFRHAYSARELVQNPSGQPAGPGMLIGLRHRPLGVLVGAIQAAGGLGLNLVLPTFLQFDIDRVVASPLLRDGLISLELVVLAGGGWFAGGRLRRLAADDRRLILAVAACAAAGLSIVVVARTDYALEVPAALWPSKYVVMPACWLWLGTALFWDRWRARSGSLDPPPYLLAVVAAGIWMTGSYALWERVLLPESLAYAPRGRWGNEQNAEDRARHYGIVMADLSAIARETGSARVWLPRWSDWDAEFFRLHGVLEWGGDQRPHGVTYLFWDLLAASPGLHLQGDWAPRDALPSRVRECLTRYAWLQPNRSGSPPAEPAGVDSRRRF